MYNSAIEKFLSLKNSPNKIHCLTAYDYPSAKLIEESNAIDMLLVGDSLGMMIQGKPDTTHVKIEHMVYHTQLVRRGAPNSFILSDLPIHTYDTPEQTVASSKQLLLAGADAVKLEGGAEVLAQLQALKTANIPTVGHLGMLPQRAVIEGGYSIKGKTPQQAQVLLQDCLAIKELDLLAVVLECVTPPVAAQMHSIFQDTQTITIGIGSGETCDGEISVWHDLMGSYPWFVPPFANPKADLSTAIKQALLDYKSC